MKPGWRPRYTAGVFMIRAEKGDRKRAPRVPGAISECTDVAHLAGFI